MAKPSPPAFAVWKSSFSSVWSKPTCVSGDRPQKCVAPVRRRACRWPLRASNAGRNSLALASQSIFLKSVKAYSLRNLSDHGIERLCLQSWRNHHCSAPSLRIRSILMVCGRLSLKTASCPMVHLRPPRRGDISRIVGPEGTAFLSAPKPDGTGCFSSGA